jgi:hypothetical protein
MRGLFGLKHAHGPLPRPTQTDCLNCGFRARNVLKILSPRHSDPSDAKSTMKKRQSSAPHYQPRTVRETKAERRSVVHPIEKLLRGSLHRGRRESLVQRELCNGRRDIIHPAKSENDSRSVDNRNCNTPPAFLSMSYGSGHELRRYI